MFLFHFLLLALHLVTSFSYSVLQHLLPFANSIFHFGGASPEPRWGVFLGDRRRDRPGVFPISDKVPPSSRAGSVGAFELHYAVSASIRPSACARTGLGPVGRFSLDVEERETADVCIVRRARFRTCNKDDLC
jgi:hypothetical protein